MTKTLRNYQIEAVNFLKSRHKENKNAGLFMDMRTGKTLTTIAAINEISSIKKILIVAPRIAFTAWEDELEDFNFTEDKEFSIVTYDKIKHPKNSKTFLHNLKNWQPDLLIIDEGHLLRKPLNNQRVEIVYGKNLRHEINLNNPLCIINIVKHIWVLTGTPIIQYNNDLFTTLRAVFGLKTPYYEFIKEFCITTYLNPHSKDLKIIGNKKSEILEEWLKSISYRISFKNANKNDLEQARWQLINLKIAENVKDAFNPSEYDLQEAGAEHLWRQKIAEIKAPLIIDYLIEILENSPNLKLCVFTYHKIGVEIMKEKLDTKKVPYWILNGNTPTKDRPAILEKFNSLKPEEGGIFIGQVDMMAGFSLNGDEIHFIEPSQQAALNAQAAARCDKINTGKTVPILFYSLLGTKDYYYLQEMQKKIINAQQVVYNTDESKRLNLNK